MKLWLKILIGVVGVLVVGALAAAAVLRGGALLARQFGWGDRILGSPMIQGGYRAPDDNNDGGCPCLDGDQSGNYGPRGGRRSPMMGGRNWNNQRNQDDNFRRMGPGMMGGQNWYNQPNQANNFRRMGPRMMGGELVAAEKWVTVEGEVTAVDQNVMTIQTSDNKEISISPMEWGFIQAQDFKAIKGDKISLSGFYSGDLFETGKITNTTSGDSVNLRDDSGLPLWAKRGNWR